MAVTQNSDGSSKRRVDGGIQPSCGKSSDAGPCDPSRCSDKGPSIGSQYMDRGMFKSCKLSKKRKKDNQDSLSDIDDAEIVGYLNNKEEINYKRILWEALNRKYTEAKKQKHKQTTETKKDASIKTAGKTTEKVESRKPSSKINYDALKLLDEQLAQTVAASSSYAHRTEDSPYLNMSNHGSDEGYSEDQHNMNYFEDKRAYGHSDGDYEYGDEHLDDEYFDF